VFYDVLCSMVVVRELVALMLLLHDLWSFILLWNVYLHSSVAAFACEQRMLEEQLVQQERLQSQNEWLSQQVSSASVDQQSCVTSDNSGSHASKNSPAPDERAAYIVVVWRIKFVLLEKLWKCFQ